MALEAVPNVLFLKWNLREQTTSIGPAAKGGSWTNLFPIIRKVAALILKCTRSKTLARMETVGAIIDGCEFKLIETPIKVLFITFSRFLIENGWNLAPTGKLTWENVTVSASSCLSASVLFSFSTCRTSNLSTVFRVPGTIRKWSTREKTNDLILIADNCVWLIST